jgi:RNA polymerase sigma-70 factor, ECF subfamily
VTTPAAGALQAAEHAAREAYGRLVAMLAWQWRDLAAAEDALSEAFATALARWPTEGIPRSPQAWLLTVARRELLQAARHARVAHDPAVQVLLAIGDDTPQDEARFPDERLKLMFVCAHPALPASMHAPLMLQAVLGLEAAQIANAFLVTPAAMAQRLVRAKARIKAEGLRFEDPAPNELPERMAPILEGIYAAYTIGSNAAAPLADEGAQLRPEAEFLARLVVSLLPDSAEARGLLALMLFCEARRGAQFDAQGHFVPLLDQDPAAWADGLIREAEECLWQAARLRQPGPFQLEAAVHSAHCQRAVTGSVPWGGIVSLYEALSTHYPSTGATIGHAAALGFAGRAPEGLRLLDLLPSAAMQGHQPYWVTRAHLLGVCGEPAHRRVALQRAAGLTQSPRVRDYLLAQLVG